MRKIAFLLFVTIAFVACEREGVNKADEANLEKLRIRNETPFRFDNVYVKIGESENNYGPVNANETTAYKSFDRASYPYIKVSLEGREVEFQIQPFEAPPAGVNDSNVVTPPLTCVIGVNQQTNALDLHFIE